MALQMCFAIAYSKLVLNLYFQFLHCFCKQVFVSPKQRLKSNIEMVLTSLFHWWYQYSVVFYFLILNRHGDTFMINTQHLSNSTHLDPWQILFLTVNVLRLIFSALIFCTEFLLTWQFFQCSDSSFEARTSSKMQNLWIKFFDN
jgi:hypothetical protein